MAQEIHHSLFHRETSSVYLVL